MAEQFACDLADLEPGTAIEVDLKRKGGREVPVAVIRTQDGDVYAIGDMCTHGAVSLAEGEIDGCFVECWAHGSRFDVRTGEPEDLPATEPVPTYPVRIEGERVLVDVDAPAFAEKEN